MAWWNSCGKMLSLVLYLNPYLFGFQLSWKLNIVDRMRGNREMALKLENCSVRIIKRSMERNFESNNLYPLPVIILTYLRKEWLIRKGLFRKRVNGELWRQSLEVPTVSVWSGLRP